MIQLGLVLIAFSLIPILTKRKIKLSFTLFIVGGFLGIVSGIGLENLGQAIISVFINSSSRTTILTVLMVSVLGGVMKHYNIFNEVVNTLLLLIPDRKKILMIIPSMIGVLIIPGGALLSAPFIYDIGENMKISRPRRAAINMVFRHMAMFLLPYSTSLLVVSATFPEINISKLISLNALFVVALIFLGYFFFLKNVKSEKTLYREDIGHNLLNLIIYTSPIYVAVLVNVIFGWPFYITLIGSVFIVYLLGDRKYFALVTFKSINWNTVLTVAAILILKEIILDMDGLLQVFNNMFNEADGIIYTIAILLIAAFFFGYITGNHPASLAITLPMISQLKVTGDLFYIYIYFSYCAGFLGYFFSPLHLCQAFTCEHMGVTTGELYKEYRFYLPSVFIALIAITVLFRFVFL